MTKMHFNILIVASLFNFVTLSTQAIETYPVSDKVIARSDGLTERPPWVSETMPIQESNGKITFVGLSELPIKSRPRMAFKASDSQAKAEYASLIETNLTRIVAIKEDGMDVDDIDITSFIQETSRLSLNNIRVTSRYWERVIETHNDDSEVGILKVFSLIEIPEKELKSQVKRAIKNSKTPSQFRAQMEVMVIQEWESSQ